MSSFWLHAAAVARYASIGARLGTLFLAALKARKNASPTCSSALAGAISGAPGTRRLAGSVRTRACGLWAHTVAGWMRAHELTRSAEGRVLGEGAQ